VLRWLKTVVVSDQGNGVVVGASRQVGTRKTFQNHPLWWVSLLTRRKFWMASKASTAAVGVMSLAGARVLGRVVSGV